MLHRQIYQRALRFVRRKHKGQFRAGGVPVWWHLARVSKLLNVTLERTKEAASSERFTIALAALGHDLFEDTDAKETEVRRVFGDRGFELIAGMTNRWGDKKIAPYVRQIVRSEEAVRLVKLADLYDNIASVAHMLPLLGRRWTISYFLPIVLPMRRALGRTRFVRYRRSAARLFVLVDAASALLESEMQNFRRRPWRRGR